MLYLASYQSPLHNKNTYHCCYRSIFKSTINVLTYWPIESSNAFLWENPVVDADSVGMNTWLQEVNKKQLIFCKHCMSGHGYDQQMLSLPELSRLLIIVYWLWSIDLYWQGVIQVLCFLRMFDSMCMLANELLTSNLITDMRHLNIFLNLTQIFSTKYFKLLHLTWNIR